jgi:hypothetical protein
MTNKNNNLLPCLQCGSKANDINWSDISQYHNIEEQSVDINCTGDNRLNCPVQVSISLDTTFDIKFINIENKIKLMWNNLNAK